MRRDHSIPRGEVHRLVHKSNVLQANPLDDPAARDLIVWTPPDWKPSESLPNLVDLKGYMSSALAHANWSPMSENVPERLDRLASEGMARAVVVFPDCFTKLFGNQYLNSAGSGRYADYVCDEIVPLVEAKFNCGGKGRRGVFGKSSGGYGAATLACTAPISGTRSRSTGDMGSMRSTSQRRFDTSRRQMITPSRNSEGATRRKRSLSDS
jgi:enterochelin esterase-like enzyme